MARSPASKGADPIIFSSRSKTLATRPIGLDNVAEFLWNVAHDDLGDGEGVGLTAHGERQFDATASDEVIVEFAHLQYRTGYARVFLHRHELSLSFRAYFDTSTSSR